jgi:ankyrin repeat protein
MSKRLWIIHIPYLSRCWNISANSEVFQVKSSLTAPSNDIAAIKTLSDNGYDINNKKTYFEALDWASKEEQMPIIRVLLERGTDIDAHNEYGETMLFYACKNGFEGLVGRLFDQESAIKARGRYEKLFYITRSSTKQFSDSYSIEVLIRRTQIIAVQTPSSQQQLVITQSL